ncbi:MAG: transglycosylase domain-containing protein [Coriobacteriales bacterium]
MSISSRKRAQRTKPQKRTSALAVVGGAVLAVFVVCVLAVGLVCASWLRDLPDYSNIDLYAKSGYSTIYASDRSTVLGKITLENRIEVARNEVSDYVVKGTVDTEDERFYSHNGVDLMGIARALVNNVTGGSREGASTITQQLVRNTVLLDEMNSITVERKVREMYIALKVEQEYTKDQILMMYINVINYGNGNYGIETAAQDYFGCSAAELTLAQSAMLVAIPQSPTANNPRNDYERNLERAHLVLNRMLTHGDITQEEYDAAMAERPKLAKANKKKRSDYNANLAPYFVDYVKQLLQTDEFNISELAQGGLNIYTTLDPLAQAAANEAVKSGLEGYESGFDCSLTSIDPDNGNIVAMVGGVDYAESQFNLATQMSRQAGSSFKPIALVAAMEQGVDPNTYIDSSSPAQITPTWTVSNSEGEGRGNMSLRSATTYSVNTVYARLAHGIGADCIVDTAHRLGIQSELLPYESICLGAQGVNTLEMASAYATLASGGIYHAPTAILEVVNVRGETVYSAPPSFGEQRISPAIAQEATKILQTVVESGTGTAASLWCGQVAAGKTGTSENGRDLWFCGFTPQLATAVWAGYREEKPTGYYGGSTCAPIWRAYMDAVLADAPYEEFPTTEEEPEYTYEWDFAEDYGSDEGEAAEEEKPEDEQPEEEEKPGKPSKEDPAEPEPVEPEPEPEPVPEPEPEPEPQALAED